MTTENKVLTVVPSGTDKEYAEELKKRFLEAIQPVLKLCDEADERSMMLNFSVGKGPPLGKHVVAQLTVTRTY